MSTLCRSEFFTYAMILLPEQIFNISYRKSYGKEFPWDSISSPYLKGFTCAFMSVYVCVCVCQCVHVEARGHPVIPQELCTLCLEAGSLTFWDLQIRLGLLTREYHRSACLHFPITGMTSVHCHAWLFGMGLGDRTQVFILSKHFVMNHLSWCASWPHSTPFSSWFLKWSLTAFSSMLFSRQAVFFLQDFLIVFNFLMHGYHMSED